MYSKKQHFKFYKYSKIEQLIVLFWPWRKSTYPLKKVWDFVRCCLRWAFIHFLGHYIGQILNNLGLLLNSANVICDFFLSLCKKHIFLSYRAGYYSWSASKQLSLQMEINMYIFMYIDLTLMWRRIITPGVKWRSLNCPLMTGLPKMHIRLGKASHLLVPFSSGKMATTLG